MPLRLIELSAHIMAGKVSRKPFFKVVRAFSTAWGEQVYRLVGELITCLGNI